MRADKLFGKFKPNAARAIGELVLRPGDGVVDVGAGDGVMAAMWADMVGPTGWVMAVEPDRRNAETIRATCADKPWVESVEAAVGASFGAAPFYAGAKSTHGSLYQQNVGAQSLGYDVPVVTLASLVASKPYPPRLVKVDTQGAEVAVLNGAGDVLDSEAVWIVELWGAGLRAAYASARDVLRPFRSRGYDLFDVWGHPVTWAQAERAALTEQWSGSVDVLLVPHDMECAA